MPSSPASPIALLWAASFLRTTRRSWSAAAVPACIALTLSGIFGAIAVQQLSPWVANAVAPMGETWRWLWHIVRWLSIALGCYAGLVASLLITPALSGPALERLVRLTEESLDVPPRPAQGFWFELICGLRAQVFLAVITVALALGLWIVGLILPWLSPLIVALQALVLGGAIAWNLLDYPLTLRGVSYRARWAVARRNPTTILAFGLPFAALFWIPGLGIVLLPVGVVAATQVLWTQLIDDPEIAALLQTDTNMAAIVGKS